MNLKHRGSTGKTAWPLCLCQLSLPLQPCTYQKASFLRLAPPLEVFLRRVQLKYAHGTKMHVSFSIWFICSFGKIKLVLSDKKHKRFLGRKLINSADWPVYYVRTKTNEVNNRLALNSRLIKAVIIEVLIHLYGQFGSSLLIFLQPSLFMWFKELPVYESNHSVGFTAGLLH